MNDDTLCSQCWITDCKNNCPHRVVGEAAQDTIPLDDMVMREFSVVVPCVGDRPLLNAVGSNETEASVNAGLIDLTDDEMNGMTFKQAKLIFHA